MNPEFRRQLWLHFSPIRLAVLPLLQLATFAAIFFSVNHRTIQAVAATGVAMFVLLVLLMGTFAAGASVMDEITERTWDQQRMSAMQPWGMTWGKLAGATLYAWYGGAVCLLVAVPAALLFESPAVVLRWVLGGVVGGVFLQALLLAVNLQLVRASSTVVRRGGVWTFVLVVLWGIPPLTSLGRGVGVEWWGHFFNGIDFVLGTLLLLTSCSLFGAWRSMAEVLLVRQLPWGWPVFALVATVYLGGFSSQEMDHVFWSVGLLTCMGCTYLALLAEPQPRPVWQRVVHRVQDGQWREAALQLPRWPTTLVLALFFAVLATLMSGPNAVLPWARHTTWLPLTLVLLAARDCAAALFFAFSPSTRQPMFALGVLMLVLYALLPWLLASAGAHPLLKGLALPLLAPTASVSVLLALVHLALALGLLRWRWQAGAP